MSTSHHSGLITTSDANFCQLAFGNANYGVCLSIGQTDRQTDRQTNIQTVFKLLYVQPPELKNGLLYYFSHSPIVHWTDRQTDRQTDIQTVFKLLYVQPPELKNGLLYYFSPITRELGGNLRDFTNSVLS